MSKNVLVVIDYQVDFVSGTLANPAAAALETGIAAAVRDTLADGGHVVFTKDTHASNYLQTREGQFLPVTHCVQGTAGWQLYGSLAMYENGLHERVSIVEKPTFGSTSLPAHLSRICGGAPERITLCGVVTDICVVSNAVMLHSAFLETEIAIQSNLCAAVTPEGHARALALLAGMGYNIL